ncbi:DUF2914 domain-containing protein [Pseudomonas sp. ABC1]|uniref:DUF5924 family protein n=1 Tax=Pseudomonas sp. ABC1 TaxID=2748080 RepID=UPI0015C36A9E|nr:DUF5924 family protein [Pseudomonas sp. ABC1]QLF92928.1 DUF2914 domain-containing protein [Pseudomonas sp. ABC1]
MTWRNQTARLITLIAGVVQRYPGTVALLSFLSGVASFILVERQAGLGRVIAIVMLVSWLWLMLESSLRNALKRWLGWQLPPPLLRYATQMVHQESLFFILPFFFVTTAWNSSQALFTGLLGAAALVALIDPLYYRWLAPRRWIYLAFHALTLFAVLLTVLPLILHLSTAQSYQWALGIAVLFALPSFSGLFPHWGFRRLLAIISIAALVGLGGWEIRSWVPPATLWMTDMVVSDSLDPGQRRPGQSIQQIDSAKLGLNGLYAYTAISAPRGLKERIYHEWSQADRVIDRIALEIDGGIKTGYRAWSHKRNFPPKAAGQWKVRVVTDSGQVIGVLHFDVTEGKHP